MSKGLFKTIYDRDGIYNTLYRRGGGKQPMKSVDQRFGLGEAEIDIDDDFGPPPPKQSVFAREFKGFPMWLVGVFLLGFAYARRKRKKESNVS